MRIIEWNCQGAFRLKNKPILDLKPDILIIPECENESKLQFNTLTQKPNDFHWYGNTGKKGIGIFSYSNYKFRLLKEFNPSFRYVIPLEVSDGYNSFLLFAIWAMDNQKDSLSRYIGQVWNAINYYQTLLVECTILMGDFNSNQIWDTKDRIANHTDVVEFLKKYRIESLYHRQFNEDQGNETQNTFFMNRIIAKPYHIDYVFASDKIVSNGFNLTLGNFETWKDKSDHIPLILDVNSLESKFDIKNTYQEIVTRHFENMSMSTKEKFGKEIDELRIIASKFDVEQISNEQHLKFINDIDLLKQIDKLTSGLTIQKES